MKQLLAAVLLTMGVAAQAAPMPQHPDVNPDLLSQMILDSALIYCKEGKCVRMDTQTAYPEEKSKGYLDGYQIVFPENNYTVAQMQSTSDALVEYYQTYLEMLNNDEQ